MITVVAKKGELREFYCLSTDTKPTEYDYAIGNVYLYDAAGQQWKQVT